MRPLDDLSLQRAETEKPRGAALAISGLVMVLLGWLVPLVAPIAVAAYGLYQLNRRQPAEGLIALAAAALLWVLRVPLGALFWLIGAGMAGLGIFFIIRGTRA